MFYPKVARVSPDGPASRSPLEPGFEILSVNDHRIKNAQRCVEMLKHYTLKGTDVDIIASAGSRPAGSLYAMIKRDGNNKPIESPGDGSFHGLFLEDKGGRVRVSGFGPSGLFVNSKINKGDILLSIGGRPIHEIDDCERAMKKVANGLIPVLTYNIFRKFRSGVVVSTMRQGDENPAEKKITETGAAKRTVGDIYSFGPTVSFAAAMSNNNIVKYCDMPPLFSHTQNASFLPLLFSRLGLELMLKLKSAS